MNAPRKLTAILAAGVASYSGPTGPDEEGTPKRHRKLRRKLVNSAVSLDRGRIAKATGDGILIEFPSWMFAAPLDMQRRMEGGNADTPDDRRIEFEIGINPCDVAVESDPRSARVRMLPRLWRLPG